MHLSEAKQLLKEKAATMSILCVEDEENARSAIVKILSRYFGTVMEAENGEVALSLYKQHTFDMVLTDLAMPVMNGLVMSHAIKMRNREQKIIVLSGYKEEDYLRVLHNMGITHILLKPLDMTQLIDVLIELL